MVVHPTDPGVTDAVAIVTGCSSAAGHALARELASRGFAIVVVYLRDQGRAEGVVDAILAAKGTAVTVRADLTDTLDVERVFDETTVVFTRVDVLVHAARRSACVLYREAALRLRPGGAIVSVCAEAIAPALAREMRARALTVNGLAAGLEPPGSHHDVAELIAHVDHWRRSPAG